MRTFFLFFLLNSLLGNPLLALAIVLAGLWFLEAQYSGRYFNPASWMRRQSELSRLQSQVSINPHDVGAHNDIGRILVGRGKPRQALEHLRTAIKRMDDAAETNYYLGRALLETGEEAEGERYVRRALELDERYGYGEPWVVLARRLLAEDRHAEAAEAARHATSINTSTVEGWLLRGRAERALGNHEEARKAFAGAVEAYDHLPHYLRLAARPHARAARREAKS